LYILIQEGPFLTHVQQFVGYVVGFQRFLLCVVVLGSGHHSDGVLSSILYRDFGGLTVAEVSTVGVADGVVAFIKGLVQILGHHLGRLHNGDEGCS
jgi:hypothetical protein